MPPTSDTSAFIQKWQFKRSKVLIVRLNYGMLGVAITCTICNLLSCTMLVNCSGCLSFFILICLLNVHVWVWVCMVLCSCNRASTSSCLWDLVQSTVDYLSIIMHLMAVLCQHTISTETIISVHSVISKQWNASQTPIKCLTYLSIIIPSTAFLLWTMVIHEATFIPHNKATLSSVHAVLEISQVTHILKIKTASQAMKVASCMTCFTC